MSALLTDLYQLTMLQAYLDEGLDGEAVFELFVRKLPPGRNFLVAAGLEQAVEFLETLASRRPRSTGCAVRDSRRACSTTCKAFASAATSTRCPKARRSSPTSRSCA